MERQVGYTKLMRRKLLCGLAAFCIATVLEAQPVPARDLWEFPLGALLEPAALASEPGAGLWNPAAGLIADSVRWRFGVASLARLAADQSIAGQLVSLSRRTPGGATLGFSIARSSVDGITRTDADPQSIGTVTYSGMLASVTASRELLPHVSAGVAARLRRGQADQEIGHALAADLGVIVHDIPWLDSRVALSSFLWRPGREIDDRPAFVAAVDARVWGVKLNEIRMGYSQLSVNRGARESGPFASVRANLLEARASLLRTRYSGQTVSRVRTGIALHYSSFVVGVAREEGASSLGPLYQFTLSSVLR